jgi:mannan endo-1,4-beta-mannosidase
MTLCRHFLLPIFTACAALALAGCKPGPPETQDLHIKITAYEAEAAAPLGNARRERDLAGYSGDGYLAGLAGPGDGCVFQIRVLQAGYYDLVFRLAGFSQGNLALADGRRVGAVTAEAETFEEAPCRRVYLEAGAHTVQFVPRQGQPLLDSLTVRESPPLDGALYDVSPELVNPRASGEANALMRLLTELYGHQTLAGQYSPEGTEILPLPTGHFPAVLALDLPEAPGDPRAVVDRALEFDALGGIISLGWRWEAPKETPRETETAGLGPMLDSGDPTGYDRLLQTLDALAGPLGVLRDAGVPVLWRPLEPHAEAWWEAEGPAAYQALWALAYHRLTETHGLNNLLWVWSGPSPAWYPGDEYVDILGDKVQGLHTPEASDFLRTSSRAPISKLVALSRCGAFPDPGQAFQDGAAWSFFLLEGPAPPEIYSHPRIVTLEELPPWK